ncbi:trafficking protein particle complex subunit 3-like protein isoform X4 [Choloepus didactylus]|uniref:trafficking protein particle complex subunit 3-like protein isoform X4 n=1 Tax=Choloepus didactylus TaxID=27675 RepID=UPI00189CCB33|nr:trafficking protein particle complex subunit 3-like protein isoform X4 [Choloepus didactylus]
MRSFLKSSLAIIAILLEHDLSTRSESASHTPAPAERSPWAEPGECSHGLPRNVLGGRRERRCEGPLKALGGGSRRVTPPQRTAGLATVGASGAGRTEKRTCLHPAGPGAVDRVGALAGVQTAGEPTRRPTPRVPALGWVVNGRTCGGAWRRTSGSTRARLGATRHPTAS